MASPLVNNTSRLQAFAAIGKGKRISSFPVLFFSQGEQPLINKIDTKLDVETLTNDSGIAPLISRLSGVDKDGTVIMPSQSAVSEYIYALTGEEVAVPSGYKDKRHPSEHLYPNATGDEVKMMRLDWALSNVLSKAQRNVIRQINVGCWQTLTTGKLTIKDEHEGAKELDWARDASLKNQTVKVVWSTPATAQPWTDFGAATDSIRDKGSAVGLYTGLSIMGNTAFNDMRSAYRSQRSQTVEPVLYDTYKFLGDKWPEDLAFLKGSGLQYRGWIIDDSNTTLHLFTCSDSYKNASGVTTKVVAKDSVTVMLFNPYDYRMYYGPGTRLADADDDFYKKKYSTDTALAEEDMPLGSEFKDSGVEINAIDVTLFPLGKASGIGGVVEIAHLPALKNANTVATLDIDLATGA